MRFGLSLDQAQAEMLHSVLQNHINTANILLKDITNQITTQAQAAQTLNAAPPPPAYEAEATNLNGHAQEQ